MSDPVVLWRGTATNPMAVMLSAVLAIGTVTAPFAGEYGAGVFALVALTVTVTYTKVTVTIDAAEVRVDMGPWMWPNHTHQVADIEWVEYCTVGPSDVRIGVGHRGSNKKLKGRAILLRSGDAIYFQGKRGIRHRITVDGALGAVAVLERILLR